MLMQWALGRKQREQTQRSGQMSLRARTSRGKCSVQNNSTGRLSATTRRALHVPELSGRILALSASVSTSGDEPHAVCILHSFVVDTAVLFLVSGASTAHLNAGGMLGKCIC